MVDEAETPKILDEIARSNSAPAPKRSRQKSTALRRVVIILVLISPLLFGLLFLAYEQWELRVSLNAAVSENNRLQQRITNADQQVASLAETVERLSEAPAPTVDESDLQRLGQEVASLAETVEQLPDAPTITVGPSDLQRLGQEFDQEIQRLSSVIADLQGQQTLETGLRDNQLHLAEAEYLLRLANLQLQLQGDVRSSISILQTADQVLADSGDPSVFSVRQAIAREISQLQDVAIQDVEGLHIRLGNLQDQVDQLPVNASIQEAYRERLGRVSPSSSDQDLMSPQRSLIDSSLEFMRSVFVWREWEDSPDVMYPPQQGTYIKHNVRLTLEQAQMALMMRQSETYVDSLQQARNLISQYLTGMEMETTPILAELDNLIAVNLDPELPDISGSLDLIRRSSSRRQDSLPDLSRQN